MYLPVDETGVMIMKNKFLGVLAASAVILLAVIYFSSIQSRERMYAGKFSSLPSDLSGRIDLSEKVAIFDESQISIPETVFAENESSVLGAVYGEKWIEVDLSEQKLKAWDGDRLFLETLISTGLPWWPTPTGEFKIWIKLRATKMEGGTGKYYYYLPNVPYVMYFGNQEVPNWRGYGLHGTYWHDDFGTQRSHGCVNLPTEMAGRLYYWVDPAVPAGKWSVRATANNPGTRVIIHE